MDSSEKDDDFAVVEKDFESEENEEDFDDFKHSRLLKAIGTLDGKKQLHKVERTEPTSQVSEFHVTSSGDKIKLHELVGALKDSTSHAELKKKLNRIQKRKKVLSAPLPKLEQEKIQRVIAYEQTSEEISKWDPVVEKNRKAEQLFFPLEKPEVRLHKTDELAKRIKPYTSLELEVAEVLQNNKHVLLEEKVLTAEEEKALKAMSLEEAKERRAELQKYRALLSYKEAKSRRQNKIKSKKYHRVLRKEKNKKEQKRMEELEKTDPEIFLEELKRIEKDRVEERMNLKHRGGSKFMQRQKMYAKYDDKARQSIQDMVDKNKELTRKMVVESSSDEEEVYMEEGTEADPITPTHMLASTSNNPWLAVPRAKSQTRYKSPQEKEQSTQSEYSRPKAFNMESTVGKRQKANVEHQSEEIEEKSSSSEDEEVDIDNLFNTLEDLQKAKVQQTSAELKIQHNKDMKGKRKNKVKSATKDQDLDSEDSSDEIIEIKEKEDDGGKEENVPNDPLINASLTRKRTLDDLEGEWSESESDDDVVTTEPSKPIAVSSTSSHSHDKTKRDIQVDPKKFLIVDRQRRKAELSGVVEDEEEAAEAEEQHRMTISEAFASDDVVEEFNREKKDLEERDKVEDINLVLPGWGEWGGAGVQPSKRKKMRFTIKAPQGPPRRDKDLDNVIISETKDTTIAKHQVKSLPHYFNSVHQFESSVRAPIGKTWNPETAFKNLIKPKVKTQMGKIIDPINKAQVFTKQQVKTADVKGKKGSKKPRKK